MARPKGTRFANGSKPCPDCGRLCDIGARRCATCNGLRQRRPIDIPTLSEIQHSAERTADGCFLFAGEIGNHGYGVIRRKRSGQVYRWTAHRLAYELAVGPIPRDKEIHHLCQIRRCVNPAHLELVTRREHLGNGGRHLIPRDEKGRYTTA